MNSPIYSKLNLIQISNIWGKNAILSQKSFLITVFLNWIKSNWIKLNNICISLYLWFVASNKQLCDHIDLYEIRVLSIHYVNNVIQIVRNITIIKTNTTTIDFRKQAVTIHMINGIKEKINILQEKISIHFS